MARPRATALWQPEADAMDERRDLPAGVYSRRTFLRISGATTILAATGGIATGYGGGDPSPWSIEIAGEQHV